MILHLFVIQMYFRISNDKKDAIIILSYPFVNEVLVDNEYLYHWLKTHVWPLSDSNADRW